MSLWRNGLARWTSNPEVPGSSPGRDVFFVKLIILICKVLHVFVYFVFIRNLRNDRQILFFHRVVLKKIDVISV